METSKALRAAGYNEHRCIVRENLGFYGGVYMTGLYCLATEEQSSLEQLKPQITKALKKCVDQHAALSTIIIDGETAKPRLAQVDSLNLETHLHITESSKDETNEEGLEKLHEFVQNDPLPDFSQTPGWRLYVQRLASTAEQPMTRIRVAFAYSHVLADGGSGIIFHETFLDALRNVEELEYDPSSTHKVLDSSTLPPALDKAAHFPISWSFLSTPLLRHLLPSTVASFLGYGSPAKHGVNGIWFGATIRPSRPEGHAIVRTSVKVASLPHATLQDVLAACRTQKARLTGVLHQIVVRNLAKHLNKGDERQFTRFVAVTALNLRSALAKVNPSLQNCFANYPSGLEETLEASFSDEYLNGLTAEEWTAAKATTDMLKAKSGTLSDQMIGLLSYVGDFKAWLVKKSEQPADVSYEVSNVGLFDGRRGSGKSGWEISDMAFSQSADASGCPFSVNVASCQDGALVLIFAWCPGILGVEDEEALMESLSSSIVEDLKNVSK